MAELFPEDAKATKRKLAREAAARKREREAADQRLREREADFTARPVVREAVNAGWLLRRWPVTHDDKTLIVFEFGDGKLCWIQLEPGEPLRVLDIGAGAGVWSSELRRKAALEGWPIHITAVELEPDERKWLARHADVVIIADWHEGFGMVRGEDGIWRPGPEPRTYHLVLGNPPFTQARAATRPEWPITPPKGSIPEAERKALNAKYAPIRRRLKEEKAAELARVGVVNKVLAEALAEYDPHASMVAVALQHAPAVFLYMSQQSWTKTASGWLTRLHYPPAAAFDIPGSVSHREGGGGDSIPYAASLWLRGHEGPAALSMLEPFADRSWKVRPGTEPDAWCDAQGIPLLVRGVA